VSLNELNVGLSED